MQIILLIINDIFNLMFFYFGIRATLSILKQEEKINILPNFKIPKVKSTKQKMMEQEEKEEVEKEQRRLETIIKNIENYDGTDFGQIDIPD